jgi:bacillithiol system protein YtxJ
MRERMYELTTPEEVDAFITQNPVAAVFKAGTCHKTMQGWGNIEYFLKERPDVPVGVIRVVEARPASNRVAERTGIVHQSPQFVIFKDGEAQFDLDNWDITKENLEPRLSATLPALDGAAAPGEKRTSLEPYTKLMDQFLSGAISEQQFQWTYLEMFRGDANLRSEQEFALLDSLFGNPDDHHIHAGAIMSLETQMQDAGQLEPLRDRVQTLRERAAAL